MLNGKKIALGVTGGIAVYKAVDLVSRLRKQGAEVRVIMTEHAQQFVTPLTFKEISGNKVAVSMWVQFSLTIDSQFHLAARSQILLSDQQDDDKQKNNSKEYSNAG